MATSFMNELLPHLRRTVLRSDGAGLTDGELLECFISGRDDSAFAALVRRHAAMVWGVCRRVLPCHQDAEDAFQSTFLVLVRKAASVTPRHMVANWLYGVAHQTALNARASAARRRARERQVTEMPEPASPEQNLWHDLQPILDQELSRLPAKYRSAIVLCDLEGKTRKEAAKQFGVPEGTLSGWLTRGRAMLAKRLARQGLAVTGGALAAVLVPSTLAAGAPASAVSTTIRAASLWAAGHAAPGVISAPVAALTEGVLKTMLLQKLKLATALLLMVSAVSMGAGGLIYRAHAANPTAPAAPPAAARATDDKPKAPRPARTTARQPRHKPEFTISKETTYVNGPLASDGAIDYETALNERISKGITPETNANVLLWQALAPSPRDTPMPPGFFDWLKVPEPPKRGEYFIELPRYAHDVLKMTGKQFDDFRKQRAWAAQRPWAEKDYPQVAAWLKANERPLAIVVAATKRLNYYNPLVSRKSGEEGWYGLQGAPLPGVAECWRDVAPALASRAMLHAGAGRMDEAWQDLLACHRLGRLITRGADEGELMLGLVISQSARTAEVALLERAHPPARQDLAWLRDLERRPPAGAVADHVDLGLRFKFLDTVMMLRRGPIRTLRLVEYFSTGRPLPRTPEPEPPQASVDSLDYDFILRTGNRWYDRVVVALRIKDHAERENAFAQIEDELKAQKKDAGTLATVSDLLRRDTKYSAEISRKLVVVVLDSFMPAIRRAKHLGEWAEQSERNLHLAFALAAYRAEHGRYPDKLVGLAPKYLAAVPTDLFSGQVPLYRPLDNGYLLYSVGVNGVDEQGHGVDDTPRGDDIAIRIPLPKLKRN